MLIFFNTEETPGMCWGLSLLWHDEWIVTIEILVYQFSIVKMLESIVQTRFSDNIFQVLFRNSENMEEILNFLKTISHFFPLFLNPILRKQVKILHVLNIHE